MLGRLVIEEIDTSDDEYMEVEQYDDSLVIWEPSQDVFSRDITYKYWDLWVLEAEKPTRKIGSLGPKLGRFIDMIRREYFRHYQNNIVGFIDFINHNGYFSRLLANAPYAKTDYIHNACEVSIIVYAYTLGISGYYNIDKYNCLIKKFLEETGKERPEEDDGLLYLYWYITHGRVY